MACVPKPNSSDIRLIHDASRPFGKSMNSYASVEKTSYASLDQVCTNLKQGNFCAKVDLSQAYRSVPILPDNYCATGLKWKFTGCNSYTYMYDNKLCFGASKAPNIFQRITESVTRMVKRRGFKNIHVYLDDFIIVADSYDECLNAFVFLTQLLCRLGFTINWNKVIPPTQRIVFLGVLIDMIEGTLSILNEKIRSELRNWINRTKATKRQLQQIIGKLNWAAKLLRASTPFIRRLIDLMCTVNRPSHHVRLNKGVKEDLQWLLNAYDMFNGTVVIVKKPLSPEPSFSSDACTTGGAAFYNGDWLYANWSIDYPEVQNAHINIKELFTVLLAFRRWGPLWENKHVQIYTDNQVTMYALNKGTMRNDLGMTFIRELYYMLAVHNIHITVSFVASRDNIIADGLSRLDNIDYALVSGEMLLRFDELILHPMYDFQRHMSNQCASFISQILCELRNEIWTEMYRRTDHRFMQSRPKQYIVHI